MGVRGGDHIYICIYIYIYICAHTPEWGVCEKLFVALSHRHEYHSY